MSGGNLLASGGPAAGDGSADGATGERHATLALHGADVDARGTVTGLTLNHTKSHLYRAILESVAYALKNNILGEAVKNGIYFEISYGPLIKDVGCRRNLFGNVVSLLRATKGRNIVMSSGISDLIYLRYPNDVLNLAFLLGLNGDAPFASVHTNPQQVLYHAATRKCTLKAAVSSNSTSEPDGSLQNDFISI